MTTHHGQTLVVGKRPKKENKNWYSYKQMQCLNDWEFEQLIKINPFIAGWKYPERYSEWLKENKNNSK